MNKQLTSLDTSNCEKDSQNGHYFETGGKFYYHYIYAFVPSTLIKNFTTLDTQKMLNVKDFYHNSENNPQNSHRFETPLFIKEI